MLTVPEYRESTNSSESYRQARFLYRIFEPQRGQGYPKRSARSHGSFYLAMYPLTASVASQLLSVSEKSTSMPWPNPFCREQRLVEARQPSRLSPAVNED